MVSAEHSTKRGSPLSVGPWPLRRSWFEPSWCIIWNQPLYSEGEPEGRGRLLQAGRAAVLISKGNLYTRLSQAAARQTDPCTTWQILEVYKEALTVLSHIYHSGVLNTHHYLKTPTSEQPLGTGKASGTHIPREGEGARSLWVPHDPSSWVNQRSRFLNDIPQQSLTHEASPALLILLRMGSLRMQRGGRLRWEGGDKEASQGHFFWWH